MPYQLQSALGAGLADAAGFMAGQTDRKRYLAEQQRQADLDAQAQANTAATLGLQQSNDQATQAYRMQQLKNTLSTQTREQRQFNIEHGLDADTGAQKPLSALPKNLTQVSPGNKGKGPKPGSVEALKAEYAHASTLADFYATGQGGDVNDQRVKDLVAHWSAMTTQAASDLRAAQTQEAEADRAAKAQAAAVALHGTPTWGDLNLPHGGRDRTPSAQEQYFMEHGYSPPTYAEANPKPGTTKADPVITGQAQTIRNWVNTHPDATADQFKKFVKQYGFTREAVVQAAGSSLAGDTPVSAPSAPTTPQATTMKRRIATGPHKGGVAESTDGGKTWHLSQ